MEVGNDIIIDSFKFRLAHRTISSIHIARRKKPWPLSPPVEFPMVPLRHLPSFLENGSRNNTEKKTKKNGSCRWRIMRETKMIEMSALNHLMSTHVLQQAQQIEALYDQDDSNMLTAPGDLTMKMCDVQQKKCIGVLIGHKGSVHILKIWIWLFLDRETGRLHYEIKDASLAMVRNTLTQLNMSLEHMHLQRESESGIARRLMKGLILLEKQGRTLKISGTPFKQSERCFLMLRSSNKPQLLWRT